MPLYLVKIRTAICEKNFSKNFLGLKFETMMQGCFKPSLVKIYQTIREQKLFKDSHAVDHYYMYLLVYQSRAD